MLNWESYSFLVFFIYGLSFFVMGITILLLVKRGIIDFFSKSFLYLAYFGIAHGIVEWMDMLLCLINFGSVFQGCKLILNAFSFYLLLKFGCELISGKKSLTPWLFTALWALILAMQMNINYSDTQINNFETVIDISTRYLLAFPAAASASIGFFVLRKRVQAKYSSGIMHYLSLLGVSFGCYAVLAGIIVPKAEFSLASVLNYDSFIASIGIPVQIFRSIVALMTLVCLVRIIKKFETDSGKILTAREAVNSLNNNALLLAHSLDTREIAHNVCKTSAEVFDSPLAWLGKAEDDGTISIIGSYPETEYTLTLKVRWDDTPKGHGPAGRAIRNQRPFFINDIRKEPSFNLWRDAALKFGMQSIGAVPLINQGKSLGALIVYGRKTNNFSPEKTQHIQAYAQQAAAALQNAKLYEDAERRAACLQSLHEIDTSITSNQDLQITLNIVLDQVISRIGVSAASIFLIDHEIKTLKYAVGEGFSNQNVEALSVKFEQEAFDRINANLEAIPSLEQRKLKIRKEEGLQYYRLVPLRAKGKLKGLLELFGQDAFTMSQEQERFLNMLATQAAIAIDTAQLFSSLERSNIELTLAYDATIEGWSRALDLRDEETEGHSVRVTTMTLRMARALGLDNAKLVDIRRGALLHDIGKMGVPDSILLKPGPLNDSEWEIMRRHPSYAYDMLYPIPYLHSALDIPYAHHEKWDGTGYPRGLRGDEIPLSARMFAVVDVWDALSSDRPYRKAWTPEKIREHITSLSGSHFDPEMVKLFSRVIDEDS